MKQQDDGKGKCVHTITRSYREHSRTSVLFLYVLPDGKENKTEKKTYKHTNNKAVV